MVRTCAQGRAELARLAPARGGRAGGGRRWAWGAGRAGTRRVFELGWQVLDKLHQRRLVGVLLHLRTAHGPRVRAHGVETCRIWM